MKITPYIHYDLYSNGNFVKTFNSKEDIDIYFKELVENEKKRWLGFITENFDEMLSKELNGKNYSVIKSEYLNFS